ncbi:LysR family transcriptional regulator [Sphingomonas sp. MAH-20]|uniref:LysR family transcriptional regulator n=1 Tax=Sphingomonas horti TaxID=2682842 RepID=A0A6I4IWR9_9SPHN|nr:MULTISPECIES: LysR family transcriptional regulator [Sphingomonas]MBA2920356.1 LysR family transcriptional regulator [Sphingomonas sp. CGMCC 1.13658]MVO76610.1 LysR family transcriptional regulator [Sphingomonas horti]
MRRDYFGDLAAFAAVADERSFTRAAAKLRLSVSALSRTIQALEERLGVQLLARTTRSVALTPAGERLRGIQPDLDALEARLSGLAQADEAIRGTVRIAAPRHAWTAHWPVLGRLLADHPGVRIELVPPDAEADATIRLGERTESGVAAVRIGSDLRMALVASPDWLAGRAIPATPAELSEQPAVVWDEAPLWALERVTVPPAARLTVADPELAVRAALDGIGLAYVFEHLAAPHLAAGRLMRVRREWCAVVPGYHLHYPREPVSAALALVVEALRDRSGHDNVRRLSLDSGARRPAA